MAGRTKPVLREVKGRSVSGKEINKKLPDSLRFFQPMAKEKGELS